MIPKMDIKRGKRILDMVLKGVFAVKVLRDGRITIPEDQRKKIGVKEGDWIKVIIEKMEE